MSRMKSLPLATALAAATLVAFVSVKPAPAGTDISNVAYKQPVTANSYGGAWYGRVFAPNADGYVVIGPGEEARALINNGVHGSTDWSYPNADGGGAWIDLGAAYNIASIEVIPKSTSAWSQLDRATVYGSSQKTTDAEYSFIIPDKSSSDLNHVQTLDNWWGVRWIRIVDQTDTMGGDLGDMTISEIRVFAPAATWTSSSLRYIGGVTATATSTRNTPLTYSPTFLVNHNGMSDQHGPVGNTAAKADPKVGLWMNENLGTGGYVNQAVTFDLGGRYNLDQMRIWNYHEFSWSTSTETYTDLTTRGVNAALIEYSQDGGATWLALSDTNGATEGNYTIPKAPFDIDSTTNLVKPNSSQLTISLGDLLADHIRLTVKSNHGHTTYAGLSEVRFYGDAIVVPGDTNNDGAVDATDAATLAQWWGASATTGDKTKGDFNSDGLVNAADAAILAANWSPSSSEGAGSAVPEPAAMALLLAMGLGAVLPRRTHP